MFSAPAAKIGFGAGFGAPQTTPTGFGATQTASTGFGTQATSTGFGAQPTSTGFGAPQAASTGFGVTSTGFGAPQTTSTGFGAQATTTGFGAPQAASTGFGSPQPASTALTAFGAPQTAATGFGAPQTASIGFGAQPQTSSGFGTLQTSSFGAPSANTGFGSSFGAASQPASTAFRLGTAPTTLTTFSAPPSAQGPQIELNFRFNDLPEAYQAAIEQTSLDYKNPMREGLDEIARCQPKLLNELKAELGRTNLAALKLGNQQDLLLAEIRSFHDKAKDNLRDVRKYGASGLQQIQNRGGLGARSYMMSEELPTDFYLDAADKIETRLCSLIEEVQHISRQLTSSLSALSGEEGQYGQQTRIGPQQLVRLIQRQSEAFARVAACVAEIHKQADDMRMSYLRIYCKDEGQRYPGSYYESDPFAAADRAEAANERLMSKKLKAEEFNRANRASAAAPALQLGNAPAAATTAPGAAASPFSFAFPSSAPAASAASNPFGGGFSAAPAATPTFGGFGAAPASGSGFGLGLSAAAPAASTFGSSFGLPATGGFGGGTGFKALDLATPATTPGLGFGGSVPAPSPFGATFGATTNTSRKSGKSRK
jgi:hypothetical protein